MRPFIESFSVDRVNLLRYYASPLDPVGAQRMRRYLTDWRERLKGINFEAMPQDGKVDYVVFRNYLDHELKKLDFDSRAQAETAIYMPFAATIIGLEETRKTTTPLKAQDVAAKLAALTAEIENSRKKLDQQLQSAGALEGARQRKVTEHAPPMKLLLFALCSGPGMRFTITTIHSSLGGRTKRTRPRTRRCKVIHPFFASVLADCVHCRSPQPLQPLAVARAEHAEAHFREPPVRARVPRTT